MKKIIAILVLCALPGLSQASGNHAGGHDDMHSGHDMTSMMGHAHDENDADAAGRAGKPEKVTRTVEVLMSDNMRFNPQAMTFKAGETVKFIVHNKGQLRHELVIGSVDELKEHAEMMRRMPGMQHADPNMITLAPGQSGNLLWQFNKAGTFDFACLQPGHFEAGMSGQINVQ